MTPFGSFLRSTSLDELPTLWNVLKGDMSLVGPRPLLVQYLDRYSPEQRRRHEVRPGITGLAQVSGRNAITWDEKFAQDVEYVEQRSLRLDLRILVRTVWQVAPSRRHLAAGEATMPEFMGSERGEILSWSASAASAGRSSTSSMRSTGGRRPAWHVVGVVDDAPTDGQPRIVWPAWMSRYLGRVDDFLACRLDGVLRRRHRLTARASRMIADRLDRAGSRRRRLSIRRATRASTCRSAQGRWSARACVSRRTFRWSSRAPQPERDGGPRHHLR